MLKFRLWLVTALVVAGVLLAPMSAAAESVNVLTNGSFEDEYVLGLSKGWTGFDNGGRASYGYHDDTWSPVVYDGKRSQLLELNTKDYGVSDNDRYFGIYQTADVVSGRRYMFSMYGMVRSTEGTELQSGYNYRVQVGFDFAGGTDPWAVTDWYEMSWREFPRLAPGWFEGFARGLTATSDKLTVFIRVWKKFGTHGQEGDINLDAVSLVGPAPTAAPAEPAVPAEPAAPAAEPTTAPTATPAEPQPTLPDTGGGSALPIAGGAAATLALGLAGVRIRNNRRTR